MENSDRSNVDLNLTDINDTDAMNRNLTSKDEKVVFEGNAFYEIDLKCVREKQRGMSVHREQRQRGKK